MDAIKIEGLTKKYKDVVAVDNLNLSVKQGEIFSLLGVNGAGKTTTIKMLSCITKPTSGNAFLMGKSLSTEASAVKSPIALSPQETAVAPGLTVKENLALMAGVHGCRGAERDERMQQLMALLGLDFTLGIVYALVAILPISLLYIALGLLCGSVLTDKQVSGVCGALLSLWCPSSYS